MKKIFFGLLAVFILSLLPYVANSQIRADRLPEITTPADTDAIYTAERGSFQKITLGTLRNYFTNGIGNATVDSAKATVDTLYVFQTGADDLAVYLPPQSLALYSTRLELIDSLSAVRAESKQQLDLKIDTVWMTYAADTSSLTLHAIKDNLEFTHVVPMRESIIEPFLWEKYGDALLYSPNATDTILANGPTAALRLKQSADVPTGGEHAMLLLDGGYPGGNGGRDLIAIKSNMTSAVSNSRMKGIEMNFNITGTSARFDGLMKSNISQQGGSGSPKIIDISHTYTTWPTTSRDYYGEYREHNFPESSTVNRNHRFYGSYTVMNSLGAPNTSQDSGTSKFTGNHIRMNVNDLPGTQQNVYALYIQNVSAHPDDYGIYQQSVDARNYLGGRLGVGTDAPRFKLDIGGNSSFRMNPHDAAVTGEEGVIYPDDSESTWKGHNGTSFFRFMQQSVSIPSEGQVGVWSSTTQLYEPTTLKQKTIVPIYCQPHDSMGTTGINYRGWRVPSGFGAAQIVSVQYSWNTSGSGSTSIRLNNGTTSYATATVPVSGFVEIAASQSLTPGQLIQPDVLVLNGSGHKGLMINLIIEQL